MQYFRGGKRDSTWKIELSGKKFEINCPRNSYFYTLFNFSSRMHFALLRIETDLEWGRGGDDGGGGNRGRMKNIPRYKKWVIYTPPPHALVIIPHQSTKFGFEGRKPRLNQIRMQYSKSATRKLSILTLRSIFRIEYILPNLLTCKISQLWQRRRWNQLQLICFVYFPESTREILIRRAGTSDPEELKFDALINLSNQVNFVRLFSKVKFEFRGQKSTTELNSNAIFDISDLKNHYFDTYFNFPNSVDFAEPPHE